jgi:hypothetical protein
MVLNTLKLWSPKYYQKITLSNLCSVLLEKKFCTQITIRPSLWLQILLNSCSTLRLFLWDALISKYHIWQHVQNLLKFFTITFIMISGHLDKSHDFLTSFPFFKKFKNILATTSSSCSLNKTCKISFDLRSKVSK